MIQLTEAYIDTGDIEVRGVDEEGRRSFCRASRFHPGALEGARQRVIDDIRCQIRTEIANKIATVKEEIVSAAVTWCRVDNDRGLELTDAVLRLNELRRQWGALGTV